MAANFPRNMKPEIREYLADAYRLAQQWRLPCGATAENSEAADLRNVGVVGGGTMGRGIAIALVRAGYESVTMVEHDEKALETCRRELVVTYKREQKLGRLHEKDLARLRSPAIFRFTTNLNELSECDLVIEAIFENMAMKLELIGKLDRVLRPDAVVGSNTSTLDIDKLASALRDPSRLVGIHFFTPAHVIRVVELVHGSKTSGRAVATAFAACQAMKKVGVLVGNCPAFVFNRLLFAYMECAHRLCYIHGLLPHDIDKAITSNGFLMGPLTVIDMNGIDVSCKARMENGWPQNPIEEELMKRNRYGRKTGAGFYFYDKSSKKHPDVVVENIIRELADKHGKEKNTNIRSKQDILEFVLFPLVNEGFHCLEEGMIADAKLIDILFVLGFGWPLSSGGPMRWAEKDAGLHRIHAALTNWAACDPDDRWYRMSKTIAACTKAKI